MDLGKIGDKIRENKDAVAAKVEEAADKLIDSKLDGEKAQKAKDAIHSGLSKGVEELDKRLGGDKAGE
ncbi:hypothetical protein C1Y63_12215 [Corynebacterium sp. 13CS0277]|uniref:hypothetical protein n=1 Tax=Corynebacterium sp. 13CS0277 TaxID=2071994 RepID=UPI000D02A65D|nr:hypothetical protein [Corynebacterium sp. 13CS0277]PRQ10302.1 hypothetical protein C1Y63_12215 [Corynebacterium sp. 13CS0277]